MSLQNKFARLAVASVVACVLLYFFPLVGVRTLGSTSNVNAESGLNANMTEPSGSATMDVTTFVEALWTKRLPEASTTAASLSNVLAMAATDAEAARKKYGREVGLGGPTFLFLRGRGQIESVNDDECTLIIEGQSQPVVLEIGILVSNAIRDATGLANVGDFPNSQDFNKLSTELNRRCESEVIEPVRGQLVVGAVVEFVGCGEVRDDVGFNPLKLIPVQLKVIKATESKE